MKDLFFFQHIPTSIFHFLQIPFLSVGQGDFWVQKTGGPILSICLLSPSRANALGLPDN